MNIDPQQIYIIQFAMFRQSLGEVENTLRECPKCQRQNQPTRKYCTRCGANLLKIDVEQPPAPKPTVAETPATPITPQPEPAPVEETPLVRPSKVETDRVIPPSRHVEKTELEKAQEAFAKADGVGIEEETGEGIVETRMLRASEVRELMDSAAGWSEPAPTESRESIETPETPSSPPMPTSSDIERGILGAKSEYVDKPKPVPEPPQPEVPVTPPPKALPASKPVTAPAPTPTPTPVVVESAAVTVESPPDVTAEMWEYESKIPDKEYLDDFNIKGMLSDMKHLLMELRQAESDLGSCCSRHDETVTQYKNAAEVKRINSESLEEKAKHAKEEWNDADKEYRLAEDRRKKEISSREKRVDKIQKQIKKAESTLEKRVKELDKEKERRAQEQAKRT